MKTKGRFTSADVRAVTTELKPTLEGCHLQNIYDIDNKKYLFKFTKKSAKVVLMVESGVRVHATKYDRENLDTFPSSFVTKLRKHLRDRRLTAFSQLGFDRVVHLEFGHDSKPEMTFHLFLEFYALGNVVLTDYEFKVLSLLREVRVKDKESGEEQKMLGVGIKYSASSSMELSEAVYNEALMSKQETVKSIIKKSYLHFTPSMIDSCLQAAKLEPTLKLAALADPQDQLFSFANRLVSLWNDPRTLFQGIIVQSDEIWCDFFPTEDHGSTFTGFLRYPTFNEVVDEYFFRIEKAKLTLQSKQKELAVVKKFAAIKAEQESRIRILDSQIDEYRKKAQVIEANIPSVEDAILVINTGLQNDLSWDDLEALVLAEKGKGRPIALMIKSLNLASSLIELTLPFLAEKVDLDVDIKLGGYANANRYYELRRNAIEKLGRTRAAFDQAMGSAEAKVRADSRKETRKNQHMIEKRKAFWFEKFSWFISSDSYLVLSGKDMHQNEYLVKRMLKAGDAYVHADLTGASSVIVKNHRKLVNSEIEVPAIPHRTLVEAGAFSLCFSKAWEAKITTSAWWVHADQVSKAAPSGEYLGTGSFMIRGKKNFLPPTQLILGFGFMFILDEAGTLARREARSLKEIRRDSEESAGATGEASVKNASKYLEQLDIVNDKVEEQTMIFATGNPPALRPARQQPSADSCFRHHSVPEPTKKGLVRGKHGKEKKIKAKYKDQDAEEREARMAILKSVPRAKTEPSTVSKPPTPLLNKKVEIKKPVVKPIQLDDDSEITVEEVIGANELTVVDSLTGNPTPDETILGCIAVAAPFMVVQHYKYRTKLMPGALKRGSAVKTSLSLIMAENRAILTSRERDLIRSVPDTELNSTMPGKVRVVGSNVELSKIKKASKKKK